MTTLRFLFFPAVIALFASCHKAPSGIPASSLPEVAVTVQPIEAKSYPVIEEVMGSIHSRFRANVEGKISGRIIEMPVDLGQRVKKGDLLATIDAQEVNAQLDRATANRDQAEQEFKRLTILFQKAAASKQELDSADNRLRAAVAAMKEAETMLGYVQVKAPFSGIITQRNANPGDFSTPGKPLLELENPELLRFEADVPATLVDTLQIGNRIPVSLSTLPNPLPGEITGIAPTADRNSRTFLVRMDLPETKGVRAGQFGRALLPVGEALSLRVPASAVIQRGQMEMVFIQEHQRARMRLVKTGKRLGNEIQILSGVEKGESVIVSGVDQLVDGQPCKSQSSNLQP